MTVQEQRDAIAPMWIPPAEAAERLGVPINELRKAMREGRVPFAQIGRLQRIQVSWVMAATDRAKVLATGPLEGLGKEREPEDDILDEALRRMDPRVVIDLISYDWLLRCGLRHDEAADRLKEWRIAGHAIDLDPEQKRPARVPERATRRWVATTIGKVPVWYWAGKRGWHSKCGGPKTSSMFSSDSMMEAVRMAGDYARDTYGKRVRRTSIRLRFAILNRDGFTCRYCGRRSPTVELMVDHIIPFSKGGTDDPENLCAACSDCNAGKSDVLL